MKMYYSLGQNTLRLEEANKIILLCTSKHSVVKNYGVLWGFLNWYRITWKKWSNYCFAEMLVFFLVVLNKI